MGTDETGPLFRARDTNSFWQCWPSCARIGFIERLKMKAIYFENEGCIDLSALRTFGVSAKEIDNPIGRFGTGLKYAIAVFLRHGCKITLSTNNEEYVFGVNETVIRNKTFQIVTMNDEKLSFTTELGKDWEPWQAFREIFCNTLDENGSIYLDSLLAPIDTHNRTVIKLSGSVALDQYYNRDDIFLNVADELKINDSDDVEIFKRPSKYIFYRGIRVYELNCQSLYTYNILSNLSLTEDRTIKSLYQAENAIVNAIGSLKNKDDIRKILTAMSIDYESTLSLTYMQMDSMSIEFKECLKDLFKDNDDRLNANAKMLGQNLLKYRGEKFYVEHKLDTIQEKQLFRAVKIVDATFNDFKSYKIIVVKNLGQTTLALADTNNKTIVISSKLFEMGTKYIVLALIEEYMHLKTGFGDCTRAFQTSIFENMCSIIEKHVIKEPI